MYDIIMVVANEDSHITVWWIWVAYRGHWTSGSNWTGGKKKANNYSNGGAPVGTIPFFSSAFAQCTMEMVRCLPRPTAMCLTVMPGTKEAGKRAQVLRSSERHRCVLFYSRTQLHKKWPHNTNRQQEDTNLPPWSLEWSLLWKWYSD